MKEFIILGLLAWVHLIASESRPRATNGEHQVCSTQVCREWASIIKGYLKHNAMPCDDFYDFACGGWESKQNKPTAHASFGIRDVLAEKVTETFRSILESITPKRINQNIADKVGFVYNACITFPNASNPPDGLLKVLASYGLADWPLLDDTPENDTVARNITAVLLKIGLRGVFDVSEETDHQNSSHVLQIRYPRGTISDEEYRTNAIKQAALFIKPYLNETRLVEIINRTATYGKRLKGLSVCECDPEKRPPDVSMVTIGELQTQFPKIPLLQLLKDEFRKVNITISESDVVQLKNILFYERLASFLQGFDPIDIYNYAGVRVMVTLGEHVSSNVRAAFLKTKRKAPKGRWEECIGILRSQMSEALEYLYVHRRHNRSAKGEVEDTARRIKDALRDLLLGNSWTDRATKDVLAYKLNSTRVRVGYPEGLLDYTFLEKDYKDIPPIDIKGTFVEMLHNISESRYLRELRKFKQPYHPEKVWAGSGSAVHISYSSSDSTVVIPWGHLEEPVYHYGLPRSISFGAFGVRTAYEITRSLDIRGVFKRSSEKYPDPIRNLTLSEFEKKARCLISQYDQILVKEMFFSRNINGTATLEENIADNLGLQSAFNAYAHLLEKDCENVDTLLEGIDYSGKELFYITSAMASCELMDTWKLLGLLRSGSQSPPRSRVNEPMKNSNDFATTFSCGNGSVMGGNENTCQIW